jgi:hypothetical protein
MDGSSISRRTALTALAAAPLVLTGAPALADIAPRSVLWDGDPSRGTGVFDGLEKAPGDITTAADPKGQYGQCFRYDIWDHTAGKERCETRGLRNPNGSVLRINDSFLGQTQYIGWRSLWTGVNPNAGKWIAVYQLHVSGVSSPQVNVGPFVLRTVGDGKLYFQHISPDGADRHLWSSSFPVNSWNTFAIGYRLSRGNDGWVEFYYNGTLQKFSNGQTRYPGPTIWGSHVNHKWGIYRSGGNSGRASAHLNRARLGTTYADVAL